MPFAPIDPPARTAPELVPVAYTVRFPKTTAKTGKNPILFVRFAPAIAQKAGIKAGDHLTLGLGSGADLGTLRFMPVLRSRASRRVRAGGTAGACLTYSCPYTDQIPKIFPPHRQPTTLPVIEASQSQGLIIRLPEIP